jgi:UDP-N-acetylmuramyl pentapeptide synthase
MANEHEGFRRVGARAKISGHQDRRNFNNHVGLPRTILEATSEDEVAVWEIGMNHPGEIAALSKIAAPDAAIITNIGVAHIEFMGSREAIAARREHWPKRSSRKEQ